MLLKLPQILLHCFFFFQGGGTRRSCKDGGESGREELASFGVRCVPLASARSGSVLHVVPPDNHTKLLQTPIIQSNALRSIELII